MKPINVILIFTVLIIIGCARGANPVTPEENKPDDHQLTESQSARGTSNHALWAWAELRCDTQTGDVELIPHRVSELHLNVLNPIMAELGMEVSVDPGASDPPNGLFVMDISLTHPFPTADKFSGFDVKGILITPGTYTIGGLVIAGPEETKLINRDGLTRWWNPTEFTGGGILGYSPGTPGCQDPSLLTATVNPYKIFADALGDTSPLGDLIIPMLDDPIGRAIFTAGATNTRRYVVQFPVFGGPVVIFNYAVDASWQPPNPNPPGEVPDDFPMGANQPEAFRIQIIYPNNTLIYLEDGGVTGELRVRAVVSDWQGMSAGNIQDEISTVQVYAPTLLDQEVTLDYVSESFDHAIYEADVSPHLLPLDSADPHLLLVRAETAGVGDYTQGGINIGPAEPISALQSAWVEIATVTCEPDGNEDFSEAEPIDLGGEVFGTLCNPGGSGIDEKDYYVFEVPPATVAYGAIGFLCEETVMVTLFDGSYSSLGGMVAGGSYKLWDICDELVPDTYYIKIATFNEDQMIYYDIYNLYVTDPCSDPISFGYDQQIDIPFLNNVYTGRRSTLVHYNHVWVVYSEGSIGDGTILCRHSHDFGLTFDPPAQVNQDTTHCTRQWPALTLGMYGLLCCAWIDYSSGVPEPFVNLSVNDGQNWFEEVNIYDFETGPLMPDNDPKGIQLGTDDNGRLHAVWMDERDGLAFHLYYSYSDDMSFTWEPAVKIDDSATEIQIAENNFDMDVSPSGTVIIVWTDRRHLLNPPLTSLDIYFDKCDSVTPFGTDVMVNAAQIDMEQNEPGVAITDDEIIHVAWVDRRNDGAFGGTNPPNTWELYYARSEDGGSSFIAEQEILTDDGYSTHSYMQPRLEVSPWGNVYIFNNYILDTLLLSKSCDGGNTWDMPIVVLPDDPDTYLISNLSFDVGVDGQVFASHCDTRNEPGSGYTHWNLWLGISE